jgi:hypothetical protein
MTAPKDPLAEWCPNCESVDGQPCYDTFTKLDGRRISVPREEPHQERIDRAHEAAARVAAARREEKEK